MLATSFTLDWLIMSLRSYTIFSWADDGDFVSSGKMYPKLGLESYELKWVQASGLIIGTVLQVMTY